MSHSPCVPHGCSPGTMERKWRHEELSKAQLCSSFLAPWFPWLTSRLNSILLIFGNWGLAKAAVCWDLLEYRACGLDSIWVTLLWFAFAISPVFQACMCPGKSRRGAQVLHGLCHQTSGLHGLWFVLKCFLQPWPCSANEESTAKGSGADRNTYFVQSHLFIMKDWQLYDYALHIQMQHFFYAEGKLWVTLGKKLRKWKLLIRNKRQIRTDNNC